MKRFTLLAVLLTLSCLASLQVVKSQIDLKPFHLEHPIKKKVSHPELSSFSDERFTRKGDESSITMTAKEGDTSTTNGSGARVELKESTPWSPNSGIHTMTVATSISDQKPIIVVQIFNLKINKPTAFVKHDKGTLYSIIKAGKIGSKRVNLDKAYKIGNPFKLVLTVSNGGKISIQYTNSVSGVSKTASGTAPTSASFVFKTGSYCQKKGISCQTVLSGVGVSHTSND